MRALFLVAALTLPAQAQWTIQTPTTADLRGIDNAGNGIAWASGTNGTILRTTDAGTHWQTCTIPPNAEHLDFRGIQAFDANTAIVMSSGPGTQSRLYKTTDGCQTWTLIFTNPDKEGFWDSVQLIRGKAEGPAFAFILGDQVHGHFTLFNLRIPLHPGEAVFLAPFPNADCGTPPTSVRLPKQLETCDPKAARYRVPSPKREEAIFAASNTALLHESTVWFQPLAFVTGGPNGARFLQFRKDPCGGMGCESWVSANLPLKSGNSAGAFSLAARENNKSVDDWSGVVVGGDYTRPDDSTGTAAYSTDEGQTWQPATTPPHGFRSAVAYDAPTRTWITVGPNGTDISTDDGRNWRPLHPSPTEPPDADQHWNALSLPYAVGPHGRIGLLNPSALRPTSKNP
jgi:hypothetical protein